MMTSTKTNSAQRKNTRIRQHPSNLIQRSWLSNSISIFLVLIYVGDVVLADSTAARTDFKIPPPPPPPPSDVALTTRGNIIARDVPPPPPKTPPKQPPMNLIAGSRSTPPPPPPPRTLYETVKSEESFVSGAEVLVQFPLSVRNKSDEQQDVEGEESGMKEEDLPSDDVSEPAEPATLNCEIDVDVPRSDIAGVDAGIENWSNEGRDTKQTTEETKYDYRVGSMEYTDREERNLPDGQIERERWTISETSSVPTQGAARELPSLSISTQQDPGLRQPQPATISPDQWSTERQTQSWHEPAEMRQYIRPLGHSPPHQQVQHEPAMGHYRPTQVAGQMNQRPTSQRPSQQRRVEHPPLRHAQASPVASAWKAIWGKVEKGLDTLADLEDSVTGRAHQLLSTVSSGKGRPVTTAVESPSWSSQAIRSAKMMPPTSQPLAPYGNKFEVAKKKQEEKNQVAARQSSWSELTTDRIIRANGGASSPDGQHPLPPSLQDSASAVQSPTIYAPPPGTGNDEGIQHTPQSSQYIPNPYLQSSITKPPPTQPAAVFDAHSRAARIPWDSSTGSSGSLTRPTARGLTPGPRPDYELEKEGFGAKLTRFLPSLPNPVKLFRFGRKSYGYASADAWDLDDDEDIKGGFFGFFRKKQADGTALLRSPSKPTFKTADGLAPPLKSMMERCGNGKTTSLLLASDETRCRTMGRYQAFFDGIGVLCVLVGIQQTNGFAFITLPLSLEEFVSNTLPLAGTYLRESLSTWAPIFLGYAYLALYVKRALLNSRVENLANSVGSAVQDESQYAQLYLRLAAAIGIEPNLPSKLKDAAASQVHSLVSMARLDAFVAMLLGALIVMTVTIIGPIFSALGRSVTDLFFLEELRSWPIAWQSLGTRIGQVFHSLVSTLESLMARGLNTFLDNPVQFSFQLSIFFSSVLIALIPCIERGRKIDPIDDEEVFPLSSGDTAQQFAKLGSSSATRLTMLSENGSIESALERWRSSRNVPMEDHSKGALAVAIRSFGYKLLVAMVATLPIVVSYLVGMSSRQGMAHIGLRWDSLMDVSIVLIGVFMVASNAIENVVLSTRSRRAVLSFVSSLSSTIEEIKETNRRQADIQFMASVSPTAGLVVRDLWAAHTTKRAWAVRGATFQCRNGEILVVLGDDGAGKSRLLTTIAEALLSPPRRSLTSNKVRGFVGIGGVESSKWDKAVLRRRLGVLLSDVRTVADAANLYSGCSMEEILEPVDGVRVSDGERKLGASERSSILLALKITGLFNTLIPKLPSKLSTVLTANEEELRPSSLGPRSHVLSPGEWSKLILSKVLAQTIHDNDNAAASTDKVENCLVGSVLLLDDPTSLSSEVDEAKILKDLRQTGAATVIATNKWATGRFADKIVVVRDGAIVESGTHNDLISRGPQQSLYAAKWHSMTMQ